MLNPNSPVPLYHQLAEIISDRIRSGEYEPGQAIPSETALAGNIISGAPQCARPWMCWRTNI